MNGKEKSSLIQLICSMLIFGSIGIFRRYIPMSSALLAMVRGLIGGIFLLLFVLLKNGKHRFEITKKQAIVYAITGALIGINWLLLFEAYNYTSIAIATLCYYMQPTIVILLSPLFFKEKLNARKIVCVLIAVVGIALVSGIGGNVGNGVSDFKGAILGLSAAALYAAVVIINKKNPSNDPYGKTIIQLFCASGILLPYIWIQHGFALPSMDITANIMVLIVCIVHTGIAYAMYFGSMDNLKSQTVALLSYIDPVSSIVLSAVFLKEPVTLLMITGAILVLGAAAFCELKE